MSPCFCQSKEERILELETEKAILHLRLAEAKTLLHHQREAQSITQLALGKLLAEVQNLKQVLSEIFAVYANGVAELEGHSKQILEKLDGARALNGCHGDDLQRAEGEHQGSLVLPVLFQIVLDALRSKSTCFCNAELSMRQTWPIYFTCWVQSCSSPSGVISSEEVIHVSEDTVFVNCSPVINKVFEFERVHGPEDSQNVVFEEPLLTSLLDGYNVCIMEKPTP
ncbi:unnamed protein product [Gadus morhua 'NCC']